MKIGNALRSAISKIWHTGRAPEGAWRPAAGMGDFGNIFPVNFGNGWERNLSGGDVNCNGIVYALVQCYVLAMGASGIDYLKKKKGGGVEVITSGPTYDVLRYPNSFENQVEFISVIVANLFYNGNFYGLVTRDDREVITGIYPLPSKGKRGFFAEDGSLFYDVSNDYSFQDTQDLGKLVPARNVLHIKLPSTRDLIHGETMIAYAINSAYMNSSIIANTNAFNTNGSQPSGVLTTEATLTSAQMIELRKRFDEVTKGANRGGVPILGNGLKWEQMSMSASDAQLVEMYNLSVIDLCRIFRVPPQILGLERNGAASSVEALINQWRASGLLYYCELIEAALERLFALPSTEEFKFDLMNIARADMKTTIETLATAVQNGIYSPDEARNKVGLDSVPFGDSPRVQAQNVRLEDAKPAPSAPAAPAAGKGASGGAPADDDDDDDDEKKSMTDFQKSVAVEMLLKRIEEKA